MVKLVLYKFMRELSDDIMDLKYKNIKEILISIVVGFSIGLSIIVPGVSGSTISIAFKVYDKLIYSISNIFKKFKLCFLFLLPIAFGALIGVLIGVVLIQFFLERFPFQTICLFVGLMIGTYPIVFSEIKEEKITPKRATLFGLGFVFPLIISIIVLFINYSASLDNLNILNYILFLVIGILIALTQIIPGLSATALLMIFGYFTPLMNNIGFDLLKDLNLLLVYIMLVIGFIIGMLLFSNIINKILDKHRKPFFFLICGLSLASIISIFLGKDCIEIYKTWDRTDVLGIIVAFILLVCGICCSYMLYIYDKKHKKDDIKVEVIE